jgi:hypothetical protein
MKQRKVSPEQKRQRKLFEETRDIVEAAVLPGVGVLARVETLEKRVDLLERRVFELLRPAS